MTDSQVRKKIWGRLGVECMQGFKKLSVDDIFPIFMGSCGHLSITPAPNQTYLHFSDTNKQKKIVKYSQEL